MSRAICTRCGADKPDYGLACPACGSRPEGDALSVAWLLSSHNLGEQELDAAADRIRAGEVIRPGARQLERARRAMGQTMVSDPGLSSRQRVLLVLVCLLLTPLPAWVMAVSWMGSRPRAAVQSLALAIPSTVLFTALGLWGMYGGF